jgi:two-component system, chemotaxis family, protein-glutamate methylesterase/glutaminase
MMSSSFERSIEALVIGASAGGVEVISTLLAALSPSVKFAVFIVLHIPRDRPAGLVQLFQQKCVLPVREAQDKEPVLGGNIYVAPPDYHLLIDAGPQLALSHDEPVHFSRPSIDVLFESAADIYKARLLGIILSGGNDDGAAGLYAVQQKGGLAIVQEPTTALVSGMPAAALRTCKPDIVAAPQVIASILGELRSVAS